MSLIELLQKKYRPYLDWLVGVSVVCLAISWQMKIWTDQSATYAKKKDVVIAMHDAAAALKQSHRNTQLAEEAIINAATALAASSMSTVKVVYPAAYPAHLTRKDLLPLLKRQDAVDDYLKKVYNFDAKQQAELEAMQKEIELIQNQGK